MLQSMRQLAHSWIIKGLMLFLMISFSIWGIGDIFRGNPLQKTVAKVGNSEISVQDLNHSFEQTLSRARATINPNLTAPQAKQMGMFDLALNNDIKRDLVDQDIKRQGIAVSGESVLEMIADQPQLRNKDGSFNKTMFRQLLQQQGMTEQGLIQQGQQDLSRQILIGALSGSRFVPQTEIDALYNARAQKRVLDVVTVDAGKIGDIPTPTDNDLHAYYDAHTDAFTAPEYRALTVATLSTDSLSKDITISDDQVKKEYDDKLKELAQPEKRDVLQVVVQDETKARDLAKQARASGSLDSAAKQVKETAIPLDGLEEKTLMPDLSKTVFAMKTGEVSDPIKTQLGWHVLQLKKITAAGTPDFASIKDKLREEMKRDQAIDAATREVNQLDDQLAAGRSLDDIADELRLRLVKIPALDATGLQPDGKSPAELPNKAQVLKDGFAQNAGETSPVEDDKQGHYYVVRTDNVTPAAPKAFDSVREKVAAAWKAGKQLEKAKAEADEITRGVQDGKPVSAFTSLPGVSSRQSAPISQMGDSDAQLPTEITAQAFALKKGGVVTALKDQKAIIARVASISDADTAKNDPRKGILEAEIKKSQGDELLDQYIQHLYVVFPVKTDAELLDRLRQQD